MNTTETNERVSTSRPADSPFDQRLPASFYKRVQQTVASAAAEAGLDGILTDDPEDVAYLCGFFFHACERPVAAWISADGDIALLLPELEHDHALAQNVPSKLLTYPEFPGTISPFTPLVTFLKGKRTGFAPSLTYVRQRALVGIAAPDSFEPTEIIVTTRMIKQPEEIRLHREAARIADLMITSGVRFIAEAAGPGTLPTEADVAAHVSEFGTRVMRREHRNIVVGPFLAGGLVYAGDNSSKPHALPSAYRLRPGDTFMLSLGCAVGGRYIEAERTFILGEPTKDQARYFNAVRRAQETGINTIAPGSLCKESNARCLGVLRDAGLGSFIRHRQGHGIGVAMHEPPWLEDGDDTVIRPGMVLSNEPGIYVPGHAGYRISDSMLVGESNAHPLTAYPKTLEDCTVPI
jgi:Xaa-Pro dipeptidase